MGVGPPPEMCAPPRNQILATPMTLMMFPKFETLGCSVPPKLPSDATGRHPPRSRRKCPPNHDYDCFPKYTCWSKSGDSKLFSLLGLFFVKRIARELRGSHAPFFIILLAVLTKDP